MADKIQPPENPTIDPKALERRQKDADGYVLRYQEILDKRQERYGNMIRPVWERASQNLTEAIKQLYRTHADAQGKLDDTKLNELERLRWLRLHVDMYLTDPEQKQYEQLSNNMAYTYSESYYFHAFGLEQAARVAVQVPIITHAHVMGILANPWLDDDNTYSDRIRNNTAYLAGKMQVAVEEAVTQGWSVPQTAKRIQSIAGEGYHNAVRLARTELNRAASQGASHLYMQNADILDGKRWNAALDSRTSPKCAKNDGHIYPLEYDTEEMAGRAGERICNHPNCRCKYSPVLSALGVSTKERIARGDGDTPTKFGERTYTQARTYEGYAKERVLPDLNERLANDDPRRYLRRGETMDAYNAPPAPHISLTKVVVGAAVPAYVQQVLELRKQGTQTEEQVRAVGDVMRAEVERRVDELRTVYENYVRETDQINARWAAVHQNAIEARKRGDTEAHLQLSREAREWEAKYQAIREGKLQAHVNFLNGRAEAAKEVLASIRPIGNPSVQKWQSGSRTAVKETIADISQYLPSDWLATSNKLAMRGTVVKRGYYNHYRGDIALSGRTAKSMRRVALHEMGHRFEYVVQGIVELEKQFYERRTKGEELTWIGAGYAKSEKTRVDNFISPYMGKDYGGHAYELLSMGLESIFDKSYDLTVDEEYYNFILGVLICR